MLITGLLLLLYSNSLSLRRDKTILYSRITLLICLSCSCISYNNLDCLFLNNGIGLFGGLYHSTCITSVFHIFVCLISSVVLLLTSFYPRKVWIKENNYINKSLFSKFKYYQTIILNKMGEQYRIIEYSLIILFIITGALFLISTSDLVSIFLSIELQSYGLYLLSTIYKNSEPATASGLMYFLLGGLSSCFILLSTALLYGNSGTTNLDSLYIITAISSIIKDNISKYNIINIVYWYKSYYIHMSLLIMSVGFLFKISAAPFHNWSPDVYDGIPTIVTTYVAIVSKISIFILLLELVHYTNKSLFDLDFTWIIGLLFSSLTSLVIGALLGLKQSRIKRLFAFSTISHIGFLLLSLSIHSVESIQSFMFYIMQYSISNLNSFIILIAIGYSLYFYVYVNKNINDKKINDKKVNINDKNINNKKTEYIDKENIFEIYNNNTDNIKSIGENNKNEFEIYNNEKDQIWYLIKSNKKVEEIIKKKVEKLSKKEDEETIKKKVEEISKKEGEETRKKKVEEINKVNFNEKNINAGKNNSNDNLKDINNSPIQLIKQLKGYFYTNPLIGLSLAITLFSFIGVPPLIGFFAKQMVLSSALDNGYFFMTFIAIITSVISAAYYLFVIKQIFFDKPDYIINPELKSFNTKGIIVENNNTIININNIVISSYLSLSISMLTLILILFIFIPQEWLSGACILSLILFTI